MKIPYGWLREWVDVSWEAAELGQRLTLAGFELEGIERDDAGEFILEINVTPNRGDAMSVLGIARETAALAALPLKGLALAPIAAARDWQLGVTLDAGAACPKLVGRVIRGIDSRAPTPAWMQRRLKQCGIRSIHPVVDVTNYVLLELGQPMHAYDLAKLHGALQVRMGRTGEALTLLDSRAIDLQKDVLVIADDTGPVGLAGIMGGERTSVSTETADVFLEVAFFAPDAIAGRARRFGLHTDASQRFERGVDPSLQERAVERATELILQIAGGSCGKTSIALAAETENPPRRAPAVRVRRSHLERLLGTALEDARVESSLRALQMTVQPTASGWQVTPPPHRFDITIEPDIIEEVARLVGYDAIPEIDARVPQRFRSLPEAEPAEQSVLEALAGRGYHEIITLAFVDPALQQRLFPDIEGRVLANAIASDLSVMRVSLWPGLLRIALENQRRQQDRIRLFEHGTRFADTEIDTIAGVALGPRLPEQWGITAADADFFDVKADVESMLSATGEPEAFSFEAAAISCLHPGRAARIIRAGREVGHIGELHPELVRELGFTDTAVLFELDMAALRAAIPRFAEISRFPQVRRDLAVIIDDEVSLSALRERVTLIAPKSLQALRVFDVYKGKGVEKGRKSIAFALIFQDYSRTLTDADADAAVASVVDDLRTSLNARIRE